MMKNAFLVMVLLIAAVATMGQGGGKRRPAEFPLPTAVAAQKTLSIVLGCPTDTSIIANILSQATVEGYIEYGSATGKYEQKTATQTFAANSPNEVLIDGLKPDTQCFYRLLTRSLGQTTYTAGSEYSFHTQRAPGSSFTFAIQGDSHPERIQQFDPALYTQTLSAVAAGHPDFYLTIGDDFSVDTLPAITADTVKQVYLRQRYFLSLVGQSAPLFLVNGNHEQAAKYNLDGPANNVAVWAQNSRNSLFPQPAPDRFYTGDAQQVEFIGSLRDYYAWTWGDALFVTIDPYWHSAQPVDNVIGGGAKRTDLWEVTLDSAQYQWLKKTLEESKSKYKFVFTHHVLGTGRGGVEEAGLYEWGGQDKRGVNQFAAKRPGWELPIHQLMVKSGVTIFFQGHDHIFVRQQLDGMIYQTLPEPADPYYALYNSDAYLTGDRQANSGYVRVNVAPEKVTVDYVREYLPKDETAKQRSGETSFSYTVPAVKPTITK